MGDLTAVLHCVLLNMTSDLSELQVQLDPGQMLVDRLKSTFVARLYMFFLPNYSYNLGEKMIIKSILHTAYSKL